MAKRKKSSDKKPLHRRGKNWPWRETLPEKAQLERLQHKEAAKQREVVDVVIRYLVQGKDGGLVGAAARELETQMTREQLAEMQVAHAEDRIWINYIKEPAR